MAPCLQPGGEVEFYLPAGEWQQLFSTQVFDGGRCHKLTLALNEMAVLVRKGDTIPMGPAVEHTGQLDQ